ncbi:MAG: phosphoenolpyruvate-utilizing N-terminal domain-containing protein, partial [Kiloniellaceae bacterium]
MNPEKPAKAKRPARKPRARTEGRRGQHILEGLGVSPGVAIGIAYPRDSGNVQVVEFRVPPARVPAEINRFREAVARSERQVLKLKRKPRTIEGMDVAHLGGGETVASLVQFIDGLPFKPG